MTAATPGPDATPDTVGELVCSARSCRAVPGWGVLWNNPKLHTPERRKVWLACDAHREHLSEYLRVRDFLRDVVRVDELVRAEP
ncbi:hypothetical protein [Cellulomonas dongxiuzhuiae]|uniref:Acetone carboxylase n=1 Tax=Cellulomonas dongxiuzhuiae TaxID=2819979 RepID=A0ABX8GPL1_9CELL|nr:hypothetical protein [Cellulomonas dongxiuzhuiae]MBO3087360.1 hypothetical protein [Cellulomonas dongxiuzhuiae]MBO3093243.1 hypothetical protein [Cellulomonas dongxiuzhuiae]QWC17531.1 hypothetical protein KKR89_08230 [Cellulomonas dongxiuzhuiae]